MHALVVAAVLVSRPCLLEAQHLRAAGLMAYIPRNSLTKSNRAWDLGDKKPTEVSVLLRRKLPRPSMLRWHDFRVTLCLSGLIQLLGSYTG